MGRWIAIGRRPGWESSGAFEADLADSSKWRADAQTTISSVYALGDGRLIAECQAPKLEQFEGWLNRNGWQVETLTPVIHVAKCGSIWKVRS